MSRRGCTGAVPSPEGQRSERCDRKDADGQWAYRGRNSPVHKPGRPEAPRPPAGTRAEPVDGDPRRAVHGLPGRALRAGSARAVISGILRNEHSPLARVKSLNYLDVLARHEAETRGPDDALLLNTAGDLACASAANLFLLLDGTLVTPSVTSGALPGTVRELVTAELAPRVGLAVERKVRPQELCGRRGLPHERVAGNPTLNRG